jgi:hypothetical protein
MTMARELFDRMLRSVKESATSVARESERLAKLARIRLEIGTLQARQNDQFEEIGRQVLVRHRAGVLDDIDLAALCLQAEEIDRKIAELEKALAELRAADAGSGPARPGSPGAPDDETNLPER